MSSSGIVFCIGSGNGISEHGLLEKLLSVYPQGLVPIVGVVTLNKVIGLVPDDVTDDTDCMVGGDLNTLFVSGTTSAHTPCAYK